MAATLPSILTVDLADTVGQESAIEANGSSIFQIEVTCPAVALPPTRSGEAQEINGFGRVLTPGPVRGYEVLYTLGSVR